MNVYTYCWSDPNNTPTEKGYIYTYCKAAYERMFTCHMNTSFQLSVWWFVYMYSFPTNAVAVLVEGKHGFMIVL